MRIPKQFQLGGTTWKVEQVHPLMGAMGATFLGQALVQLDKQLPKQVKEQTFCHELIHCVLFSMGKPGTEHDEVFIDAFATFLHQFLTSAR